MNAITIEELMDIIGAVELYNSEYDAIEIKFKELLKSKKQ